MRAPFSQFRGGWLSRRSVLVFAWGSIVLSLRIDTLGVVPTLLYPRLSVSADLIIQMCTQGSIRVYANTPLQPTQGISSYLVEIGYLLHARELRNKRLLSVKNRPLCILQMLSDPEPQLCHTDSLVGEMVSSVSSCLISRKNDLSMVEKWIFLKTKNQTCI